MIARRTFCAAAAAACVARPALAAPSDDIVALQLAPWVGHAGEAGWNAHVGIQLAFDEANARGGIRGRKLRLEFEEEERADPAEQLRRLHRQWSPIALVGSVNGLAVRQLAQQKVLDALQLPAIGVHSGDPGLRATGSPYLFVTRPSLLDELKAAFEHLATVNATRAVLVASGEVPDLARHAAAAAQAAGVTLVDVVDYRDAVTADAAARRAIGQPHNAVVIGASTLRTADFCRLYKAGRSATQIVSLSTAEPTRLASFSGKTVARGVMFALTVPNPRNRNLPLVQEFLTAFTRMGPAGVSPTTGMFESYIAARLLVDAVERGGAFTAPHVAAALGKSQPAAARASLTILDDEGKMLW
jgi:branched-chain amino acid transport system substrate-binding protein